MHTVPFDYFSIDDVQFKVIGYVKEIKGGKWKLNKKYITAERLWTIDPSKYLLKKEDSIYTFSLPIENKFNHQIVKKWKTENS